MLRRTQPYITVREAAKLLGIKSHRIYYLRRRNKIDWVTGTKKREYGSKRDPYIRTQYLVSVEDIQFVIGKKNLKNYLVM